MNAIESEPRFQIHTYDSYTLYNIIDVSLLLFIGFWIFFSKKKKKTIQVQSNSLCDLYSFIENYARYSRYEIK